MYIPGINYNRRTYGEAQEDITRFGKMAAAAGEGAIAAARLQGQVLANDYNAKSYDLQLSQTLETVALTSQGIAMENKWAAFAAVGNIGATILNDVITPIYNQKASNQEAESNRVYKYHMEALALDLESQPTRIEERSDGVEIEISNANTLHQAWADGHEKAKEEASKMITLGDVQRSQDQAWADNEVTQAGVLDRLAFKWEKEKVKEDWANEYAVMDSRNDFAGMELSLQEAKSNQTIDAAAYTKNLLALRGKKEAHDVQVQITALTGTEDPKEFAAGVDALEARLRDTNDLTRLAGADNNSLISKLAAVRSQRNTEINQANARVKAGQDLTADLGKELLQGKRDQLKAVYGDGILATNLPVIEINLQASHIIANQSFSPGSPEYHQEHNKIADSLVQRYVGMADLMLNREGDSDLTEFSELRASVLAQAPGDLGFGYVDKPSDYKNKLIDGLDKIAGHHKDQIIADGEDAIRIKQFGLLDSRQYVGPVGPNFQKETLGYKSEKSESEILNDYYTTEVLAMPSKIEKGDRLIDLQSDLDARMIWNLGSNIPSVMEESIADGLSNDNPVVAIGSAMRLSDISKINGRNGARSGGEVATDIYGGLTESQRAVVDFFNTTPIKDGVMTNKQLAEFEVSINYHTETDAATKQADKTLARKEYNNDEKVANLLTETMTTLGYSEDAMKNLETRPDYANLRNLTQIYVEKYAGQYAPPVAAHKAARDALSQVGVTDRKIDQSVPGNLESFLNHGEPMPGMSANQDKWIREKGVSDIFDAGGVVEIARPMLNADGSPVIDQYGKPMYKAFYTSADGQYLEDAQHNPLVYYPDPYNFDFNIKDRKANTREGNKQQMKLGQEALAFIYEAYPNMEDDFWNPKERDYTGTPFADAVDLAAMVERGEISAQAVNTWALSRAQDILPSAFWTNYDPEQVTARKLPDAETLYIETQVSNKFDMYLMDNLSLGDGERANVQRMRRQAVAAALWYAEHNTKGYPGFAAPEEFDAKYPDVPRWDDKALPAEAMIWQ